MKSYTNCISQLMACIASALTLAGCERDFSTMPKPEDITFSVDTLSFDTIYAGVTTPTAHLTIRNVGDNDITLGRIYIAGGSNSVFGVNINGTDATEVTDARLGHGDSLFVFVNVRKPEALSKYAFGQISDQIVVESGTNNWHATLHAVVRNVHRVKGTISKDTQWAYDTIPYWVEDTLSIGEEATLLIAPKVTVLMSKGSVIDVQGQLMVAGEVNDRCEIRPVRDDGYYETIPGQWGGIRVKPGAKAMIDYTDVSCSANGISCDSASVFSSCGMWLHDISHAGLSARKADVKIDNSIISDCGGGAVCATSGSTRLRHVTIADYFSWAYRDNAALRFTLDQDDDEAAMEVINSIVMGNKTDEVVVDSLPKGHTTIKSSLVRATKKQVEAATDIFTDCLTETDAYFADRSNADYHLTPKSKAIGIADPSIATELPTDLEGVLRSADEAINAGALQSVADN